MYIFLSYLMPSYLFLSVFSPLLWKRKKHEERKGKWKRRKVLSQCCSNSCWRNVKPYILAVCRWCVPAMRWYFQERSFTVLLILSLRLASCTLHQFMHVCKTSRLRASPGSHGDSGWSETKKEQRWLTSYYCEKGKVEVCVSDWYVSRWRWR